MIVITATVTFGWVPDGAGAMEVPSAQQLTKKALPVYGDTGMVVVPGGNNPSSANITTALNTLATNMATVFETTANLAIIQGWQNGTG